MRDAIDPLDSSLSLLRSSFERWIRCKLCPLSTDSCVRVPLTTHWIMHGCLLGGNQTRISGSPPELSTMEKILDKRKCVASAFPANANHSRRSNRERRCSIPFSACAAGCDEAAGHDSDSSDQKLAGNDGSDVDYNPCHILGLSLPFLGLRSHSHPRFTPRSCTPVEQIILAASGCSKVTYRACTTPSWVI